MGINVQQLNAQPRRNVSRIRERLALFCKFRPFLIPTGNPESAAARGRAPRNDVQGLSIMPRILYVSDSIFFPSRLTGHSSLALSPSKSTHTLSTSGIRQLRRLM